MKIVSLTSENVKRLSAVHIEPNGNLVVIGGKNGAGKTSVLDSICYALGGKGAVPSQPIRKGAESASIVVELDDLIVKRRFTSSGSTLTVESREGAKYPSPQAMLDKLVGRLSFDPLEFSRMKPDQQAATLRDLVGIDHRELDMKRKIAFEKRTAVNRDVNALAANLAAAPRHDDVPEAEVSVSELLKELEAAQATNRARSDAQTEARSAEQTAAGCVANIKRQVLRMEELERQLADAKATLEQMHNDRAELDKQAAKMKAAADAMPTIDCNPLHAKINTAESTNRKVRENAKRAEIAASLESKRKAADKLTAEITNIDLTKETDLRNAAFPIEGLGFSVDGVTFGGLPLEQASSAESTSISAAIGIAANPELRVMLIRNGSLFDDESMMRLVDIADEKDTQVWIERVGEGAECSVIIEDGAVKAKDSDA